MEEEKKGSYRLFIELLRKTNPSYSRLAFALGLSVVTTMISLLIPLLTKELVDGFSMSSLSGGQIGLLIGVFILQAALSAYATYALAFNGQKIVAGLRERLWTKLIKLPVSYSDRNGAGESISRMTNDTMVVKELITTHFTGAVTGIISVIGSITILFIMNWKLTLLIFIVLPIATAVLVPIGRLMHKIAKETQAEMAQFTGVLNQVLPESRLVKASNAEKLEIARGMNGIARLFKLGLKEARTQAVVGPIITLVLMAALVGVIGYGGMQVSTGAITAGSLVAFILYIFQIIMPMGQITMFFTQLQKSIGATERIIDILAEKEEKLEAGKIYKPRNESIRIENLLFRYEDNKEPILQIKDATIEAGEMTAVIGPSGGGKTTLFKLIERFYTPTEGRILIGDENIETYSLASWRKEIGYVSQESPLLAGTIRENICYGMEDPVTEEELKKAAEMAYALEFIEELPDMFDTEVGDRGLKLSGGQRQRIAIARAILRNPSILMLDEATSALDSQSEQSVQLALDRLMVGRTTIVIAHRLSTVVDADRLLFVERGHITGNGTHQELMETHALYREFAMQQLQLNQEAGRKAFNEIEA